MSAYPFDKPAIGVLGWTFTPGMSAYPFDKPAIGVLGWTFTFEKQMPIYYSW
jgi:hypothetical protein